jgi:hypothetical protein
MPVDLSNQMMAVIAISMLGTLSYYLLMKNG